MPNFMTFLEPLVFADTLDLGGGHGHSHGHGGHGHSHGGVAMVGWMVILGDGLHNFADGLGLFYLKTDFTVIM